MHLRPECSGTLILLIVHVDDLKPTMNQRGRSMEFSETRLQGYHKVKVSSTRLTNLVSVDEESKGKEDDYEWQEKRGDNGVYEAEEEIQLKGWKIFSKS